MRFHQLVQQLVLGLVLRVVLALAEDVVADGLPQLFQRLEIAQILGELVVQLRQFLAPHGLDRGAKLHRASGQRLALVVLRIGDLEVAFLFRRQPRADSR